MSKHLFEYFGSDRPAYCNANNEQDETITFTLQAGPHESQFESKNSIGEKSQSEEKFNWRKKFNRRQNIQAQFLVTV